MSVAEAKPARVALSRDFSAFLVELSIALHKHAMYPSGHPSLEPAANSVVRRADRLLEDRELVAIGVARRQLIIEGVATDPGQPVLRRLANTLHGHHLGAITVTRGVTSVEVSEALRVLAADPVRVGPIGLSAPGRIPEWMHVRLHPLTFDRLSLVRVIEPVAAPGDSPAGRGGWRGAELWIGLARAALAGGAAQETAASSASPDEKAAAPVPVEPAVVARAIDDHPRAEAYDQVIVGYLLQIAQELRDASGAETAALRRRTARLISALNPDTLRRLVEMGGNVAQRRNFVLDATHGMAVNAVLEILRAASDVSGQVISEGLVRMLSKLAAHAEVGTGESRPLADAALRDQVGRLLSGWQLTDPSSEQYGLILQQITPTAPSDDAAPKVEEPADRPDPIRVVRMSLEIGAAGPLVDRAIDDAVANGVVGSLLGVLASPPDDRRPVAEGMLARLLQPATLSTILSREPIDVDSLDHLLPLMPLEAYGLVLDALSTAQSRSARRRLLDRLARADADIGPLVVARLDDERWYVVRNLLVLLERLGRVPAGFSARRWAAHDDVRVRHQALRLQLTMPAEREPALKDALRAVDERLVRIGLAAVQQECPAVVVEPVIALARNVKIDQGLRLLAVRALGVCPSPAALEALLEMVDGGRTFFGRTKIAARTPAVVAALEALRRGWPAHPKATPVLAAAGKSPDARIQQVAVSEPQ